MARTGRAFPFRPQLQPARAALAIKVVQVVTQRATASVFAQPAALSTSVQLTGTRATGVLYSNSATAGASSSVTITGQRAFGSAFSRSSMISASVNAVNAVVTTMTADARPATIQSSNLLTGAVAFGTVNCVPATPFTSPLAGALTITISTPAVELTILA